MYGILWVNTYTSEIIVTFVRSWHKYSDIGMNMSQISSTCVPVCHLALDYIHENMGVWHRIFVRSGPSCTRWVCIGSSLTNFAQHRPWLPQTPASLAAFWDSSFSLSLVSYLSLWVMVFQTHYRREFHIHGYQGWYYNNEKLISM